MKKSITLMGMSGVGKTVLSRKLPIDKWFHYSGDYRIASHYLSGEMGDFLKVEAMKSPLIADLLKNDSIYISPNISVDNLSCVSAYIGKVGNPQLGGLDLDTFLQRQQKHYYAEIAACYDVGHFKQRAQSVYQYDYFLHDAGGSICELEDEKVIHYMARETDFLYLHADDDLVETITQRALDYPKPLYYNRDFLIQQLADYLNISVNDVCSEATNEIKPNDFIRFVIPKLIQHRRSRYLAIAERHGTIVDAKVAFAIRDETDFLEISRKS